MKSIGTGSIIEQLDSSDLHHEGYMYNIVYFLLVISSTIVYNCEELLLRMIADSN